MLSNFKKSVLFLVVFFPILVQAVSVGQEVNFNIEPSFDLYARKEVTAILIRITNQLYFYVDKNWWQKLEDEKKKIIESELYNLSTEFEYKIYPKLTSTFGKEPTFGPDKDQRITILIHPMKTEIGGYHTNADLYPKTLAPRSNERKMIYLNSFYIGKENARNFLAHEFMHLIAINQKEILRNKREETWLLEAFSEYAVSFLGFDADYQKSDLKERIKVFLSNPQDSLTDWQNKTSDYATVNLFIQYLVDHYGVKILVDCLNSEKTGIDCLNFALKKNNFETDFSQIFRDWIITLLVNDCTFGEKYCYRNSNLKDLKVVPQINFSPTGGESILTIFRKTKDFAPDWQQFIGGYGNLTLEFDGQDNAVFDVSYLICEKSNFCQLKFLNLDQTQDGKIFLSDFDKIYSSLTLILFSKTKTSGFDEGENPTYAYSIRVSFKREKEGFSLPVSTTTLPVATTSPTTTLTLKPSTTKISCDKIVNNLRYGMKSSEVFCLQEFLKSQGPEIYPEGLVTGYFGPLTLSAVKRFQQKYWQEILAPWGLNQNQPTGFVGPTTRAKINQLLAKR